MNFKAMNKERTLFPSKINKKILSTAPLFDKSDLTFYWHSRTPEERLQYIEILRQMNYGYHTPPRLQRILEFAKSKSG